MANRLAEKRDKLVDALVETYTDQQVDEIANDLISGVTKLSSLDITTSQFNELSNILKSFEQPTKFAEHVLPGGEPGTYRELVLRVPDRYQAFPEFGAITLSDTVSITDTISTFIAKFVSLADTVNVTDSYGQEHTSFFRTIAIVTFDIFP